MMPVIRISEQTFERLQNLAKPFVDTPASVIERLLDLGESQRATGSKIPPARPAPDVKRYDPDNPPSLTHTKVLATEFDGVKAEHWNDLVDTAHRHAMKRLQTYEA